MMPLPAPSRTALDDLEQQAQAAGLLTNKLLAADNSMHGLLLTVSETFPAHRFVALARSINNAHSPSPNDSQTEITLQSETFSIRLANELARISKTRLPSALLLIEAVAVRPAAAPKFLPKTRLDPAVKQEIISALHSATSVSALWGQHNENTLALLLNGISADKTLTLAKGIKTEFRKRPLLKKLSCAIGIAIAPSGCAITADTFLALAEAQITQAHLAVPELIHQAIYDSTRLSCQVTAEERAVLFQRPKG